MKKQILTGILALGTAVGAFAQGQISIDNINNDPTLATPGSSTAGVVYVGTNHTLLNADINITVMGGSTSSNLALVGSLTFANGLAQNDVIANGVPGQFADFNGGVYAVPGVALNGSAFIQLEFWFGNATSYAAALLANNVMTGISPVYSSLTGGGSVGGAPPNNPVDVGNTMPSVTLVAPTISPEPTTLALCGLGAASLLLFRRKK